MNILTTVLLLSPYVLVVAYEERELVKYLRSRGDVITVTHGGDVLNYDSQLWEPIRVIDERNGNAKYCSCCAALYRPAWISIDFHKPHPFTQIVVYGRNDNNINQSNNLQMNIYNGALTFQKTMLVNTSGVFVFYASASIQSVQSINISSSSNGNSNGISETVMTICEVNVFHTECAEGTYGINCTRTCSQHCAYPNVCNNVNGSCIGGCQPGYDFMQDETCSRVYAPVPSTQLVTMLPETNGGVISTTHHVFETMTALSTSSPLSRNQRETNKCSTESLFAAIGALVIVCGLLVVTNIITISVYFRRTKRTPTSAIPAQSDTGDAYDELSSATRGTENYEELQIT